MPKQTPKHAAASKAQRATSATLRRLGTPTVQRPTSRSKPKPAISKRKELSYMPAGVKNGSTRQEVVRAHKTEKQKQLDAAILFCAGKGCRGWDALGTGQFPLIKSPHTINKRLDLSPSKISNPGVPPVYPHMWIKLNLQLLCGRRSLPCPVGAGGDGIGGLFEECQQGISRDQEAGR